ncbi:hypothetical protein GEMRC1_001626 [Eukaryota sp. GEM-RC1]
MSKQKDLSQKSLTMSESPTPILDESQKLPERFQQPSCFQGYGEQKQPHPLYRTANSSYGSCKPTVHSMPLCWSGRKGDFTQTFNGCTFFNNSLNTSVKAHPVNDLVQN